MTLEEKLKILPTAPGVYLHKDEAGKIIYVGKAKNLRNRVRSYFQSGRGHDAKTRELVRRIGTFVAHPLRSLHARHVGPHVGVAAMRAGFGLCANFATA